MQTEHGQPGGDRKQGQVNQFHGDGFEYLRNNALDSRNYFDNSHITTGKRIPALRRNQFGGSFGGPIQKDKTFFYAVYESYRQMFGTAITDNVFPANCHVATANPCATAPSEAAGIGGCILTGHCEPSDYTDTGTLSKSEYTGY